MVEAVTYYDLLPGIDRQAYAEWGKKTVDAIVQSPGVIEWRGNRNLLGSPQVRTTTVWQTLADWARFEEGTWPSFERELRAFATNIRTELWGPSPVISEPVRPKK